MLRMLSATLVVAGFSIIVLTWIGEISPDYSTMETDNTTQTEIDATQSETNSNDTKTNDYSNNQTDTVSGATSSTQY